MRVKAAIAQKMIRILVVTLAFAPASLAQVGSSPWENAVNVLRNSFTGPMATGLSLVAIVVGGLTYAYAEGHSKRTLEGIIFGVGMAIGAVNFMSFNQLVIPTSDAHFMIPGMEHVTRFLSRTEDDRDDPKI